MDKYQISLPLPKDGINLIEDSLIAETEAAEGTKNISFKNGIPQTRPGYVKTVPYNFTTKPNSLYNYMRNGVRYLLAACGNTLKRLSGDTFIDIIGNLNSDYIECLTYPCLIGMIDSPNNLKATKTTGSLGAGTYSYRVSSITANGESIASPPISITLTEAGNILLTWDKMYGATGYKVYGRIAGSELLIATVNSGDTLSYIDNGSITPNGALPITNTTNALPFSDKCFILDGNSYRYYDGATQLRNVEPYNPTLDEVTAYGLNVLITTPDEVNKQKFILNDDERIWLAGYGKIVRISHFQRPDYFPSTQVWKLEEDCTGMARHMGEVLLFTANTATLISGKTPNWSLPEKYIFTKLPGGYGCANHRSIAEGDNAVYWANKDGVYRYRYLPTGYSIPECVTEFQLTDGHTRSVKKWLSGITDWSKVHAQFFDHEYRLYIGSKQVIVFNTIESSWAFYEYDKEFNSSMVYDKKLYYGATYLYSMDYPYVPTPVGVEDTFAGLNDDGNPIDFELKGKYFDFNKSANKKKFKKLFISLFSQLVSYNIDLFLNIDNDYLKIQGEIVNKVSRWGAFAFGDRITTKNTNLNYPIQIHHSGKKYNIQYHLKCNGLNMAFLVKDIELLLKIKELN